MRLILLLVTALGLAACGARSDVELESRNIHVEENAVPTAAGAGTQEIAGLIQAAGPSYVTMTVSEVDSQITGNGQRGRELTSGSGFVVDHAGYVMTAGHVAVKKGYSVSARAADGRLYSGQVIGIFPRHDMALIKLRGYAGKVVSPAANQCVTRGAMVFSLGKPHAQGDTARVGNLDSMHFGRPVAYGAFGYPDAMVLRMSTQKGESGGPLFNQSGELVGMVSVR